MPLLLLDEMAVGWPRDVDLPGCIGFDGFHLCLFHPGQIGILMYPDFGKLLLHLPAVLADDTLIGEVFVASEHAPSCRFIEAFPTLQNRDLVKLDTRNTRPGNRRNHG